MTWNYPLKGYWEAADPPTEFDVEGAAKSGEIGCFNCAHNKGTASSGEVFCVPSEGDYYVEDPDALDWRTIAECWECE